MARPGQPARPVGRPQTIAQRPEFEIAPEAIRAARQHLVTTFGKPEKALAYSQPKPGAPGSAGGLKTVEVGLFGVPPSPVVLGTAGASALACNDGVRREWIFLIKRHPAGDGPYMFLAGVAAAGAAPGEILLADDPPLFKVGGFVGVLALEALALPGEVRRFDRKDGVAVELGWVVPIFGEERRFIEANGADALWAHWSTERPDLTSFERKPSVPK